MNDPTKNHILVVDDEEDILELLKDFLEENNFEITLVNDGIKALKTIKKKIPNLIIVDLLLPGEHGINLIKTIKKEYFIPIIIISSIYHKEELEDLMEEYFVEKFFEKPLNLNQLLESIHSILDDKSV